MGESYGHNSSWKKPDTKTELCMTHFYQVQEQAASLCGERGRDSRSMSGVMEGTWEFSGAGKAPHLELGNGHTGADSCKN